MTPTAKTTSSFSVLRSKTNDIFTYTTPDDIQIIEAELVIEEGDSQPICDRRPESTCLMVRQPFKGTFRAGDFDFTLMTVHTSPSINIQELEGLTQFYSRTLSKGEPDVIILGDLNADGSYLSESDSNALMAPGFTWVIGDSDDTTVSGTDCAYDRFIFQSTTTEDYIGECGIVTEVEDEISDHYLIWAEFYTGRDSE